MTAHILIILHNTYNKMHVVFRGRICRRKDESIGYPENTAAWQR